MPNWIDNLTAANLVTIFLVLILIFSVLQGARRGASGSARQLLSLVAEGGATVAAVLLAWKLTQYASPAVRDWLVSRDIRIPAGNLTGLKQFYYTLVTGIRDFTLLRATLIFFIGYTVLKSILNLVVYRGILPSLPAGRREESRPAPWASSSAGALLGAVTGTGRALLLLAALFVYSTLYPDTALAGYIGKSQVYQKSAEEIIEPLAGNWLSERLPVFTKDVQKEFSNVLQRRYEVLDANIPDDIAEAAKQVTAGAKTDEEKARALYRWVGTRVKYDWDKYDLYVQKRIWKEQTPKETFETRQGVCIDYSRLYVSMAKSVGLDARVVTGLGYDGRGGYGPHAWNEVNLADKGWIPLDSTWVSSGRDWFNTPDFDKTHIRESA